MDKLRGELLKTSIWAAVFSIVSCLECLVWAVSQREWFAAMGWLAALLFAATTFK